MGVSDGLRFTQQKLYEPTGYVQVTDLSSAVALTPPANTTYALIQVESQNVRFRDDGVNPTASVGMLLTVGSTLEASLDNLSRLIFIEATAGATLNISYYE